MRLRYPVLLLALVLTACAAEMSNNHRLKPIDYAIRRTRHES
jgi:hypothetical protein